MEVQDKLMINDIIKDSLNNSISYNEYRDLVLNLVAVNSTTGNKKTEALANYTMLNDRRMKRWDKTVKLSDNTKEKIESYNKKVTWLVITESWCGDAAHIMPVINKVAELNDNIDYRIVLRDDNDDLMNEFLTNGGRAIPKLIMIDISSNEVVNTFGPRPTVATEMVLDYKAQHGKLTPEFKEDLQRWYNKDKGQSTVEDLVNLLK
ncbi:thioredoxin family protein [Winogradskyella sp. KYW1333]|uniref:thioredoxin family protein n=1 Tax=Winogradskyella sp. KYW1333 TaxID=2282123 RepID=UPI000DF1457E|nr:thioredoxin family protein [Winogradskyella sp. KYW1333]RCT53835.1 thioredoxin family protein [Winogradskyella sp. KYW1333]